MKNDQNTIIRYTPSERANHWVSAITFILLALSGLALFHPAFYPLTQFFGGGVWTRILHPFIGIVMAISFSIMFSSFRQLNVMTPADREWLGHVREIAAGNERNMPESGKFNGGQKVVFRLMVSCMVLLILSGIVIWRSYFAFMFPRAVIRLSSVVHAVSATIMIAVIMFHIYAGIWTKESIDAMLYGRVRRAWAKQHHAAWFRQMTGGK
ncbi:MAG: formate dehydrogenase subunit gamma [Nitrospirae bacterium]|nr:formate dehydrogenase subunit gamma [Nitrospirota bacterium]